jgi:hypothetical protein
MFFRLVLFRNPSLQDFRVFLEVATDVSLGMMEIVGPTDARTRNLTVTPQTRLDLIEHMGHRDRRIADQGMNQPTKTASIFWTSFWSRPIKFRQTRGPKRGRFLFRDGRPGVQRQAASVWCWSVFYNKYTFAGNFPLR